MKSPVSSDLTGLGCQVIANLAERIENALSSTFGRDCNRTALGIQIRGCIVSGNPFVKAVAHKLKLKLLLMGEAGTGKTWWSLSLATRLVDLEGGRIAFIDSEGAVGKAQLYAPYFDFDHLTITDHSPESYCRAISAAIQNRYTVVIVDSFTQAWNGNNGVISIADKAKTGWAEGKQRHRTLVQMIHDAKIHIIGTVRCKNTYEKTDTGSIDWKNSVVDAKQEGEFEFEWDMSAILDKEHHLTIRKTRCFELPDGTMFSSDEDQTNFVFQLHTWLNAGEAPPHWTTNPRQVARVAHFLEQAKTIDRYKLHLANAVADVKRAEFDTPEAYVEAIKLYCSPEAALERAKVRENRDKEAQQAKIRQLGDMPKLGKHGFEMSFDDLKEESLLRPSAVT